MKKIRTYIPVSCALAAATVFQAETRASIYDVTVDGPDAIFLSGRSDLSVPAASQPWDVLLRHDGNTPEESLETMPSFVPVAGGDMIRPLDPAVGGINFFLGFGPPFFGPGGNTTAESVLDPLGGISGYIGPQGALTAVFLSDAVPSANPPETLDFGTAALGIDFLSLSPLLGQVFYFGDGRAGSGILQQFIAPAGATRMYLGIPDGFDFMGAPGAYDDNDGSYQVRIGVNEFTPEQPHGVPDGGNLFAVFTATVGMLVIAHRKKE